MTHLLRLTTALLLLASGAAAQAQDEPQDTPPKRSVEEIISDLERDDPLGERGVAPSTLPQQDELRKLLEQGGVSKARLIPEGTRVATLPGIALYDEMRHEWLFVPAPGDRPMPVFLLLPCLALERLERQAGTAGRSGAVFSVSGEVFVTQERNALLMTAPAAPLEASPEQRTTLMELARRAAEQLDSAPGATGEMAAPTPPSGSSGQPSQAALRAEGTMMVSRLGRLVREGSSDVWLFVFEADRSGQSDPPMAVLPCQALDRAATVIRDSGDRTQFLLSGRVFAYRGQNYILPTVLRVPYERTNLSP